MGFKLYKHLNMQSLRQFNCCVFINTHCLGIGSCLHGEFYKHSIFPFVLRALQEENADLHQNLVQTVVCIESLEAELQRTREELSRVKDKYKRSGRNTTWIIHFPSSPPGAACRDVLWTAVNDAIQRIAQSKNKPPQEFTV